jgi:ERCC4-type nuclease
MIHIDDRTGSAELLPLFLSHRTHPPASIRRLPAADFAFSGNGPRDLPVMVGIERKTITDMLNSIRTGRFSGEQLPKLLDYYEFSFLLLEGVFRIDRQSGMLIQWRNKQWTNIMLGKQSFLGLELQSFLTSIELQTPVRVHYSSDQHETVDTVLALQHYFSKPWSKHHAHIALHIPQDTATIGKASSVRRFANVLKGVGWERSAAVDISFKSIDDLVNVGITLTDEQIAQGRRDGPKIIAKMDGFGKVLSQRVYDEMHGIFEGGDAIG